MGGDVPLEDRLSVPIKNLFQRFSEVMDAKTRSFGSSFDGFSNWMNYHTRFIGEFTANIIKTGASTGRDAAYILRLAKNRVQNHGLDINILRLAGYHDDNFDVESEGIVERIGIPKNNKIGILFVPGYIANQHSQLILNSLADEFDHDVHVLVQPYHKHIREQACNLARHIEETLLHENYNELVLVGHSMGGLVVTDYLKNFNEVKALMEQQGIRISLKPPTSTFIQIASPNQGTVLADLAYSFGDKFADMIPEKFNRNTFYSYSVNEMRLLSPVLVDLWDNSFPEDIDIYTVVATRDNIVTPPESAIQRGRAINVLSGKGNHASLIGDDGVARLISYLSQVKLGDLTSILKKQKMPNGEPAIATRPFGNSLQFRMYESIFEKMNGQMDYLADRFFDLKKRLESQEYTITTTSAINPVLYGN